MIAFIKKFINSQSPGNSSFLPLDQLIEKRYANTSSLISSQTNAIGTDLNTKLNSQTSTLNTNITNARNYLCLKPVTFNTQLSATTTAGNILSVSGPGVFQYMYVRVNGSTINALRIILDGTEYIYSSPSSLSSTSTHSYILSNSVLKSSTPSRSQVSGLGFSGFGISNEMYINSELYFPFKKSLVISYSSVTGNNSSTVSGRYSLYSVS